MSVREVTGLQALSALVVAVALTAGALRILEREPVTPVPRSGTPQDWRPDISKCPDDVKLWDCIKNANYLEEK